MYLMLCRYLSQKTVLDFMKLELEMGVSHLMWGLKIKLRSFLKAESAFKHLSSPTQQFQTTTTNYLVPVSWHFINQVHHPPVYAHKFELFFSFIS